MQEGTLTLAPFSKGWVEYQRLPLAAFAPLADEQLAIQAAPWQRPVWLRSAHIIGTRAGGFHDLLGEGDCARRAPSQRWGMAPS